MPISNNTCRQRITTELFPKIIFMPRPHGMRTIPQMCGKAGTRCNCLFNNHGARCSMSNRNDNTFKGHFPDKINCTRKLWRKCQQFYPITRSLLILLKFIINWIANMLLLMGAPRAIFVTNIRAFQMKAGHATSNHRITFTSFSKCIKAMNQNSMCVCYDRWANCLDTVQLTNRKNLSDSTFIKVDITKSNTHSTIDLQIKKRRGNICGLMIWDKVPCFFYRNNFAIVTTNINHLFGLVMLGTKNHFLPSPPV